LWPAYLFLRVSWFRLHHNLGQANPGRERGCAVGLHFAYLEINTQIYFGKNIYGCMQVACLFTVVYGVVDPHRFDANLDPDLDPTFHFDADPDKGPEPALSFTHVGMSEI
jgi:hypothetical protein